MDLKIERMKSSLECDDSFIKKLFDGFSTESSACISLMESSLENMDWKKMRGAAHKMIGSSQIFELDEIVGILETIELDAEKETNLDTLKKRIDKLKILHAECLKMMNSFKNHTTHEQT